MSVRACRALLVVLLTSLGACDSITFDVPRLPPEGIPGPIGIGPPSVCPAVMTMNDSGGPRMRVGAQVRFEAVFHETASTAYVIWRTSDASILEWAAPKPPCPGDRCALLTALRPGTANVVYTMCANLPGCGCSDGGGRLEVVE